MYFSFMDDFAGHFVFAETENTRNTESTESTENEENMVTCSCCGQLVNEDSITRTLNGDDVCEECLEEYYICCDNCGEYVLRDYAHYYNNEVFCEDCFDDEFCYCGCCDEYVPNDDYNWEYEVCNECYEREYGIISSYHSHEYNFIGEADPKRNIYHKGIELEIDYGDNNIGLATTLNKLFNNDIEHIYFEHDGSLSNGFEIITHAHTMDEFNKINWSQLLQTCVDNGYKSHDTSTCGLHIHYSREFFGKDENIQAYNIGKLIAFYERNFDDLLRFSRRTYDNYKRWADRYYSTDSKECSYIGKSKNHSRYHAINLTNYYTVEFRLGRGTLNYNSFMAWNDFHDTIIRNVKKTTYKNIDDLSVWFKGLKPETKEYLKSRNCFMSYVNN